MWKELFCSGKTKGTGPKNSIIFLFEQQLFVTWITVAEDQCSLFLWHKFAHTLKEKTCQTQKTHATWNKILMSNLIHVFELYFHFLSKYAPPSPDENLRKTLAKVFYFSLFFRRLLSETPGLHIMLEFKYFLLLKEIPVSNYLLIFFHLQWRP